MAFFEISDTHSLKSHHYDLRTTIAVEKNAVLFLYLRDDQVLYSATRFYAPEISDSEKKQLALNVHDFYKRQLAKLFYYTKKMRQNAIQDARVDLLARGYLKYGMAQEAIALLEPFVKKYSHFSTARATLGKAYFETGDFKTARVHFVQLLAGKSINAESCFYFGLCEYHLRNCSGAFRAFTRAIAINKRFGAAYFYLGLTLLLNFVI